MVIAPPGLELIEEVGSYHDAIVACVERDPRLRARFSEHVPSKMSERQFWSIYFYKVAFLIEFGTNVEHGTAAVDPLEPPGAAEGQDDGRELDALPASGAPVDVAPAVTAKEEASTASPEATSSHVEADAGELTAEGDDDFTLAVHREVTVPASSPSIRGI